MKSQIPWIDPFCFLIIALDFDLLGLRSVKPHKQLAAGCARHRPRHLNNHIGHSQRIQSCGTKDSSLKSELEKLTGFLNFLINICLTECIIAGRQSSQKYPRGYFYTSQNPPEISAYLEDYTINIIYHPGCCGRITRYKPWSHPHAGYSVIGEHISTAH